MLTLLLTAVAFKLVISDSLPKVGYFTALDIYMNMMFGMLFFVAVENGTIASLKHHEDYVGYINAHTVDTVSAYGFLGMWLIFHAWFFTYARKLKQGAMDLLKGIRRNSEAHHAKVRSQKGTKKKLLE